MPLRIRQSSLIATGAGVAGLIAGGLFLNAPAPEAQTLGMMPPENHIVVPPDILPHPVITRNLSLTRYAVNTTITGSTASSRVSLDFRNDTGNTVEGDFVFPVPPGAVMTDFALRDGDKRLDPELLDEATARQWYEEIVAKAIDPGLLEYIDQAAYRVRAFPFQAGQSRTIEISFSHQLPQRGPLSTYDLPLTFAAPNIALIRNLQGIAMEEAVRSNALYWEPPTATFVATVDINQPAGLGQVTSPTHNISVSREGNTSAHVSTEAPLTQATPKFSLMLGRASDEFTATVLTHPGSGNEDGYFTATIYPSKPADAKPIPKNLVMVLDTSGSMEGEKWTQAQGALEFVINHLGSEDQFALIDYDDLVNQLWDGMRPANSANKSEAVSYVRGLLADGGTNINDALTTAGRLIHGTGDERPDYLLFFTDGLPTVGVTDVGQILANVGTTLPSSTKLFTFGVGYDVNTTLLDSLSRDHHGASDYVEPAQNIESVVSAFYQKIQNPVLTDIQIDFEGLDAYNIFPTRLPDLFQGTELHVTGRYRGTPANTVTVVVTGARSGRTSTERLGSPATPNRAFAHIPRLWANMRVGNLIESMRISGETPELIEEIRSLAQRYGIVTPYTSYLVREDMRFNEEAQLGLMRDRSMEMLDMESGAGAVQQSKSSNARTGGGGGGGGQFAAPNVAAEAAPDDYMVYDNRQVANAKFDADEQSYANGVSDEVIVNVGNLTFLQSGIGMVDSRFVPAESNRVIQVAAFSDRYFALLDARPELGAILSLGSEVTVMVAPGIALQTVLLDPSGTPVAASQVNALRSEPNSQTPASYNAASDADWTELGNALKGDYYQG